ncbi:MAG: hypothetical protein R3C44_15830 [Chloroflexota bacterium]
MTGSTTNQCGFSADWTYLGDNGDNSISVIDFGFPVEGHFIMANPQSDSGIDQDKAFWIRTVTGSQVTLQNWVWTCVNGGYCGGEPMGFTIIVY